MFEYISPSSESLLFVCVSTSVFPTLLDQAMERLAELEFTAVELSSRRRHTSSARDVLENGDAAIAACSDLQRLRPVALSFAAPEDAKLYDKFDACCVGEDLDIVTLVAELPSWALHLMVRLSVCKVCCYSCFVRDGCRREDSL